ncbi:MAG: prenyltransferase/squalene oxidase repeat-containing protein [Myxococcota bacterium]
MQRLTSLLLSSLLLASPALAMDVVPEAAPAAKAKPATVEPESAPITPSTVPPQPAPVDAVATRKAGARWLVQHQNADGGWGAASFAQRNQDRGPSGQSDVATTSLALMALQRDAGETDAHQASIRKGLDYVLRAIEKAPARGVSLDAPKGTQPQGKLGPNVDTHFAALLLGDVDRRVGEKLYTRTQIAYDKVLSKVVAAQRKDGSFDANGWAPVLSSSVAARSLYTALDKGKRVDQVVLDRAQAFNEKLVDEESGRFDSSSGAGVDLYAAASALQGNKKGGKTVAPEAAERAERKAEKAADRLREDQAAMIRGFGSVGGEEMLSYMMISDTLAEERGDDWETWQTAIASHLRATQNGDGSWSGHHCITSTPFVTAAAVLTLGAGDAFPQVTQSGESAPDVQSAATSATRTVQ